MKQIFLYFAMLGTLAGLSSCLDEVPYGTYSNQTFEKVKGLLALT